MDSETTNTDIILREGSHIGGWMTKLSDFIWSWAKAGLKVAGLIAMLYIAGYWFGQGFMKAVADNLDDDNYETFATDQPEEL